MTYDLILLIWNKQNCNLYIVQEEKDAMRIRQVKINEQVSFVLVLSFSSQGVLHALFFACKCPGLMRYSTMNSANDRERTPGPPPGSRAHAKEHISGGGKIIPTPQ